MNYFDIQAYCGRGNVRVDLYTCITVHDIMGLVMSELIVLVTFGGRDTILGSCQFCHPHMFQT